MRKKLTLYAQIFPIDHDALMAITEREHVDKSEAVRLVIREAARARGLWPEPAENESQEVLTRQQ